MADKATPETSGAEPEKDRKTDPAAEDKREDKATEQRTEPEKAAAPSNVENLDAARQRKEGIAHATRIANLCSIAGCPERVSEFLSREASIAEVEQTLLESRAAQAGDDVSNQHGNHRAGGNGLEGWKRSYARLGILKEHAAR